MKKIGYLSFFALLLLLSASAYGCSSGKDYHAVSAEYSAAAEKIIIDLSVSDVSVTKTEGDVITVEYFDKDDSEYHITSEEGILRVERESESELKENIRFGVGMGKYYKVSLGIPESFKGEISVATSSGDITVSSLSISEEKEMKISCVTGEVRLSDLECTLLSVDVTASDTEISGVTAEKINVETETGEVYFLDCKCGEVRLYGTAAKIRIKGMDAGTVFLDTCVGDVKLNDCKTGGRLTANLTTGSIEGKNVSAGACTAVTTTGDVYFASINVGSSLTLVSDTGDISLSVTDKMEEFTIGAKSDYGKNNLKDIEKSDGLKTLELKTVTGDISVKFAEK